VDGFGAAHAVNRAPALLEKRFSCRSARFAVDFCATASRPTAAGAEEAAEVQGGRRRERPARVYVWRPKAQSWQLLTFAEQKVV
jgi:hypothetical protein